MTVPVALVTKKVPLTSEHALSFLAAGCCAVLSAVVYLGSMTYTLAHHRHWAGAAAFLVSAAFALVALLSTVPHLANEAAVTASVFPRAMMWGTSGILAALQIIAAVLGEARFSLSSLIGTVTVLAVACFGEMAGFSLAEA
ncbi:hypothetical protein ACFPM3_11240 [Streptomyces coeruleoprunus]|uniref:Integral membrane protein n=1 Tax=Streptomyces coeruleoprunus TaxID=285563 RepID=A0ABV9XC07_9ACTN